MASLTITAYAGTTYKAMIVQGNTKDVGDCKEVYNQFKAVPNGNNDTIENREWQYTGANGVDAFHNYKEWADQATKPEFALACAQDLIDANDHPDHPANDYDPGESGQPEIIIGQTLCLTTPNWASTSKWNKSSRLKVVIFAACKVLDNENLSTKILVRAMKSY